MSSTLLRLTDIHKTFGGVAALKGARLEVAAGEIHGLVGENGAGKSTLINIATGVFRPTAGEIRLLDEPVSFSNPTQAAARGIAVVHQEADLFPQLSVAENMLLGRGLVRNRLGLIDWRGTYREAQREVNVLGESFAVREQADGLSIARRMMSGIAAAVSQDARVLFLDEPTASLTRKEIENLFTQVRRLRDAGVGIVYVSHRLEEILELTDRVTVMRDGETIETQPTAELTMDRIVSSMVGRETTRLFTKRAVPIGEVRLSARGLTDREGAFSDVSFEVRAGEILGVYGFVGAGRSEMGQALFGLRRLAQGEAELDGRPYRAKTPQEAARAGLAYLPEDRLVQGVFRTHTLRTNASVSMLRRLSRFGWIRGRDERDLAERVITGMHVRAASQEQTMGTLSGGNQQKVVFGRWESTNPSVFVLDEPTRGVDVGAKAEIYKLICDMAERQAAIVLISSELPEIMAMSDRVAVLSEGRLTGVFDPKVDSEETIAAAAVPRSSAGAEAAAETQRDWTRLLRFREGGLLAFIVLLGLAMSAARPSSFATVSNFFDILTAAALPAIIAQGAILVICAGGIDISVGSMMGLVAAVACIAAKSGAPPPAALAIAMMLGCVLSLVNGGAARLGRIHPIIVTLAGLSIYRGMMLLAMAYPSRPPDASLLSIVMGGAEIRNIGDLPSAYRALADGNLLGVPKVCYYAIGVTVLVHVLLRYTLTGRRVLALGNSETAARQIGLSKTRLMLFVFGVSGALVGLAAVLDSGYYGQVQANTGQGMELKAIAAAVIGGANILGGRGSAIGGLLGAFLVAMVHNILILLGASSYWQDLFVGGLILLAVILDALMQRARGARS